MQSLQTNMPNEQNLLLPKMSGFKLASLNVTSLVKHIEELKILLDNNMIAVLAINETRLDSTVIDDEVHIHGYEIVRRDRESNGRLLIDIAELYNLSQLINEPTRTTDSSSTLIDHIFTNTPDKVVCSGVSHVSISDHSLIYAFRKLSISLPTRGLSTVNYRKFKNFDSIKFRNDISLQNWSHIKELENPNDMWHAWKTTFNCVVNKHAPLCTKRVKASKSPWITSHLKDEMHKRDIQKIKAIRSNDPQDWSSFKKMRNSVNHKHYQKYGTRWRRTCAL